VLGIFLGLIPLLVPIPFQVLGMLVAVVQTLVFCLLSMVYISLAVADDHGSEEHGH
jgi:F-type H+-transporting ATPase subunit a